MEVSRLSGMDNDLFTYKVEVANILCNSIMDDDLEDETDDDMGYDPSDVAFIECLRSKNFNYKTMGQYTMKALWIYWIRGDDEVELTDEESSDNKDEIAEVFRIDTNIFDYETPICSAFNEFNYLLKDYKWYTTLDDCELKEEALRNKAIMDGVINNDESCCDLKRKWNIYTNYDDAYEINHEDNGNKELCEIHKPPLEICTLQMGMYTSSQSSCDFTAFTINVASEQDLVEVIVVTTSKPCRLQAKTPLFTLVIRFNLVSVIGTITYLTMKLLTIGALSTVFRFRPYPFNYPTRRLTIEEMLAKFIDEVKGVTTIGGKMTSEVTRSKEINETGINKNEPPRFEQDVQEKPHNDVQIPKYDKYLKSLLTNKSRLEEACTEIMNERCSAVLLNKLPLKEKDPRSFTIPCQVLEKHKEAKILAANHLFENPHMEVLAEREIADKFSDEHLMVIKSKFNNDEPWYVDFVNYIVGKVVPPFWTFEKRKRFFSQVKTYYWEEPYAFKLCADNIMRRCVAGSETLEILAHCHSGPTGGHHSASVTAKKVYESEFYWPSVFKDANKYVEAQALPTNDAHVVVKFLRSLFARFGVPKALISDRKTHFCNSQLEKLYKDMVAIKRILERSKGYNPKGWSEKLNDALWAFRTAYKTPTWCTPFRLVYGKACHLPVEIEHKAHWALKQCNMDLTLASKSRLMQLNKLAELRDGANENTRIYKERTKKWHESRLRSDTDFKVGDQVLLYKSRLKMYPEKLKSKWSGPNIVKTVYPHGAIEITDRDGFSFKVNGQRLKKYYGCNIDKEDDDVLEFENGVT
ncbi:reverse transcriptase domain-containing protein [Tanacetum coccineum]